MKRILITISAAIVLGVVGLAAVNLSTPTWADTPVVSTIVNEQSRIFAIEKMTCAACPITVRKAMARVEGVKSVTVDFESKTATAIFDPSVATVEDIANASTKIGYPATPIEG